MFGYVVIDKPEIKFREFDEYRSYYCGLCRVLKEKYGIKGQITLNYDMTFLTLVLSGLYDNTEKKKYTRCIAHPFTKQYCVSNRFTEYAADMNILLTYYNCMDDWKDDRKISKKLLADTLKGSGKKVAEKYPKKAEAIKKELDKLEEYEKADCSDLDLVAGCFGRIMAELFVYQDDEWKEYLEKLGFYLGKYIYLLDAYVDYGKDIEKNKYNPLKACKKDDKLCISMLTMMMAECSKAYEMLPIIDHKDILDNIIYAGVWTVLNSQEKKEHEV